MITITIMITIIILTAMIPYQTNRMIFCVISGMTLLMIMLSLSTKNLVYPLVACQPKMPICLQICSMLIYQQSCSISKLDFYDLQGYMDKKNSLQVVDKKTCLKMHIKLCEAIISDILFLHPHQNVKIHSTFFGTTLSYS